MFYTVVFINSSRMNDTVKIREIILYRVTYNFIIVDISVSRKKYNILNANNNSNNYYIRTPYYKYDMKFKHDY